LAFSDQGSRANYIIPNAANQEDVPFFNIAGNDVTKVLIQHFVDVTKVFSQAGKN